MKVYTELLLRGIVILIIWAVVSNFAGVYVYPTLSIQYIKEASFREAGYLILELFVLVAVSGYIGYGVYKRRGIQQDAVLNVLVVTVVYEIVNFIAMPIILAKPIVVVTGSIVSAIEILVTAIVGFISFNLKTKLE